MSASSQALTTVAVAVGGVADTTDNIPASGLFVYCRMAKQGADELDMLRNSQRILKVTLDAKLGTCNHCAMLCLLCMQHPACCCAYHSLLCQVIVWAAADNL